MVLLLLLQLRDLPQTIVIVTCLWGGSNLDFTSLFYLFKKRNKTKRPPYCHPTIHCISCSPFEIQTPFPLVALLKRNYEGTISDSLNSLTDNSRHFHWHWTLPEAGRLIIVFNHSTWTNNTDKCSLLVFANTKAKKETRRLPEDRKNKCAKYFKESEILPIPELVQAVKPKTISFVITDIKTRRLANVNKEKFEETLKSADIPGKYICRRSFATWDVLLPTEELAKKLATKNINTKYFRLQPEYLGKRHIKVTVCNASMELNGDVFAAYLSTHGGVEEYKLITSAHGTAFGDYVFTMILDRGGFHSIPHTITYRDTTMMVVFEGRKPLCCNCKKLEHFSRSCPQKTTITGPKTTSTTSDTINTTTMTTKTTTTAAASTNSNPETGVQPEKEEGWTLVKGNKKKSPQKAATTITTTTIAANQRQYRHQIKRKAKIFNKKRWKQHLI